MQVTILDEDLGCVEAALADALRKQIADYDAGEKHYAIDLQIAGLLRSLKAIGRPYATKWSRDLGRTVVFTETEKC